MVTEARCPACRARLAEDPVCPRCGCDVGLVRLAEAQSARLVARAVEAWARGDRPQAQACARAALKLERSPLALAVWRCVVPKCPGDG